MFGVITVLMWWDFDFCDLRLELYLLVYPILLKDPGILLSDVLTDSYNDDQFYRWPFDFYLYITRGRILRKRQWRSGLGYRDMGGNTPGGPEIHWGCCGVAEDAIKPMTTRSPSRFRATGEDAWWLQIVIRPYPNIQSPSIVFFVRTTNVSCWIESDSCIKTAIKLKPTSGLLEWSLNLTLSEFS